MVQTKLGPITHLKVQTLNLWFYIIKTTLQLSESNQPLSLHSSTVQASGQSDQDHTSAACEKTMDHWFHYYCIIT